MRIVFMGTPTFAAQTLEALHGAGHEIVAVYCQPPRRAGRGKKQVPTPVEQQAQQLGLPVYSPLNFRDETDLQIFQAHKADIAVVVAYGLILPSAVLEAPRWGCLNIHASLLPRWRGAAPIQRAIMAGDIQTGICVMQMEKGLDTGPVLARQSVPINATETAGSLHDTLVEVGASLILEVLNKVDELIPEAQPEEGVTYAHKIDKSETRIDWQLPAAKLSAHIRGLSPFPGAWCMINDVRVKVLNCEVVVQQGQKGIALDDNLTIACGTDALRLTYVQKAGKSACDASEFLRGFPVPTGMMLD